MSIGFICDGACQCFWRATLYNWVCLPIGEGCAGCGCDTPSTSGSFDGQGYFTTCSSSTPPPPPPAPPTCGATCDWTWDGKKWNNDYNDCVLPCRCFYPDANGTNVGEVISTNCVETEPNPGAWTNPTMPTNPNNVKIGGCENCVMEAYRVGSATGPMAVRTIQNNCKPSDLANPPCKCADPEKYLFSIGMGSQWTKYYPLVTQQLYPNGVTFSVGCESSSYSTNPKPPSSGTITLCPDETCTYTWLATFTNPTNAYELLTGAWTLLSSNCGLSCECDEPAKAGKWPTDTVKVRCKVKDANLIPVPLDQNLNNIQNQRTFYTETIDINGNKIIKDSSANSGGGALPTFANVSSLRKINNLED